MYRQCLSIDTEHFGACLHLAAILANQGDTSKAKKYFAHALKLEPKSVPANFGLGKILQSTNEDLEAAIKH